MPKTIDKEKLGELFFNLNKAIKDTELERRRLMLENVNLLHEIFNDKIYKAEFENWAGFLSQIEVFYSRSEVNKFLRMRKRLVDEFNLSPLSFLDAPLSRLQDVVKYATDKDHASELIDKAKVLTSRDWRQEINVFRKKPIMEDCVHDFEGIEVCKICGFKRKL